MDVAIAIALIVIVQGYFSIHRCDVERHHYDRTASDVLFNRHE